MKTVPSFLGQGTPLGTTTENTCSLLSTPLGVPFLLCSPLPNWKTLPLHFHTHSLERNRKIPHPSFPTIPLQIQKETISVLRLNKQKPCSPHKQAPFFFTLGPLVLFPHTSSHNLHVGESHPPFSHTLPCTSVSPIKKAPPRY